MNVQIERIRDQLRRAIHGNAWHGPSVVEAIDVIDAAAAWFRLTPTSHNAVELVLHIAAWLEIAARRFAGEVVAPTAAEDWPAASAPCETGWRDCVQRLHDAHAALDSALAAAADDRLDETVPGQDIGMYAMLHGAVQHSTYHAGQIMLIGRALEGGRS